MKKVKPKISLILIVLVLESFYLVRHYEKKSNKKGRETFQTYKEPKIENTSLSLLLGGRCLDS